MDISMEKSINTVTTVNDSRFRNSLPVSEFGWNSVLETFLSSLDVRETTRSTYRWGMLQFYRWVKSRGLDADRLTPADIVSYKSYLQKRRHSPLTVAVYLTAVRQFYKFTESQLIFPNIARSVRPPRRLKGMRKMHLDDCEASELLSALKSSSLRDYAMVNLIIRTGLRTIEVSRADVGDIHFKRGRRILNVWGKGQDDKSEFVIINNAAWAPLHQYLLSRQADPKAPLFTTDGKGHRGSRMSPRLIQHICKEALVAIGLEGHAYSAHSLRHTTAVSILRHGGDWKDVQRVLRHVSPATSQIYTASVEEEIRLERNPEALIEEAF